MKDDFSQIQNVVLCTYIAELLEKRENALKEWNIVFNMEKPEKITCIAENPEATLDGPHFLYLVNGDSKMLVCHLYCDYKKCSIEEFYKQIDIFMHLENSIGLLLYHRRGNCFPFSG